MQRVHLVTLMGGLLVGQIAQRMRCAAVIKCPA
jgi:hypothetical protein